MDTRYNVGQFPTVLNRQTRQHEYHEHHEHHDHHEHHEPTHGDRTESRPADQSPHECHHGHSSMVFHVGNKETILFGFWTTNSTLALVVSCLIVFIIALAYEAIKFYREWLKKSDKRRQDGGSDRLPIGRSPRMSIAYGQVHQPPQRTSAIPMDTLSLPLTIIASAAPAPQAPRPADGTEPKRPVSVLRPYLAPIHFCQTLLHMLQVTISFLLMLIFMTFNVWLCLAVVLGAGVGYFIFFVRSENVSDHCN